MRTAEEYCKELDDKYGEAWSNDYEELPKKIQEYAKYYHKEQLKLHGVSQRSELLQKLEKIKSFKWGIDPADNERRMCELIMLL